MRGLRFDRFMSGAILAMPLSVVLAIPASNAQANTQSPAAIESAVPMPEAATLAPPTAADTAAPSGTEGIGTPTEPPPAAAAPATTTTPAETAPATPAETATTTPADRAPAEPAAAPAETATVTPAEAPPPDPLASLDPADRPIGERLRDLLPKADRTFASRRERLAVEAFYQKRNYAPVWFERGAVSARTNAAIARIHAASADGLIPAEYKIPDLTAAAASADAQADAELRLTATLITFTRHLQAGRFPYARMGGEIMYPQEPPDVAAALAKLADAANVAAAIDEFSPPQPGYRALKAKLAELRGATGEETKVVRIPEGPMLRPGAEDARVPLLRQRLNVAGDETNLRYDDALATAVKAYQKSNQMNADGMIGPATLRSLNAVSAPRRSDVIDTVIANMERWRWIPRDLGKTHVVLNIPNYTLRVMNNGSEVWQTRVVVGKPSTPTPMLTETMKFITVNPTWNVPPSIVHNEYLPALAQDPTVLSRMGLIVTNNREGGVHIYQPPGDNNALGRLRFNFPNRFLVYQHDTPDKHLFAHDKRAYSHGCMRVQDPLKYAEVLLSIAIPNGGYTQQRIRSLYGPSEHNINFPTPIPVHITYQTAFVDDAGALQVRPDIYGIDAKTRNLIRSERGVVEPTPERSPAAVASATQVKRARPKDQPRTVGFFESLFGGGYTASPPRPAARVR
jgi:murein L,D-transpeptidase YcbB/YkuD